MRRQIAAMREEDGASAVEFALVLPILILLVFGIFQFGMAFNAQLIVTHAAREGARMAVVGTYSAQAVKDRAAPLSGVSVSMTPPSGSVDYYTVTVSYPFGLNIPFWGQRALTLRSTASMRRE